MESKLDLTLLLACKAVCAPPAFWRAFVISSVSKVVRLIRTILLIWGSPHDASGRVRQHTQVLNHCENKTHSRHQTSLDPHHSSAIQME